MNLQISVIGTLSLSLSRKCHQGHLITALYISHVKYVLCCASAIRHVVRMKICIYVYIYLTLRDYNAEAMIYTAKPLPEINNTTEQTISKGIIIYLKKMHTHTHNYASLVSYAITALNN